jgi:hypothetical protein
LRSRSEEVQRVRNLAARRIFDAVLKDPAAQPFKVLPDPYIYPEYYAVISRPIALADIRDFAAAPAQYSMEDVQRDLRRMVANAKKYNLPESQIYLDALALEVRAEPGVFLVKQGDLGSPR